MSEQLKVELPLDEAVVLKLRFTQPKTGEGQFGTWWLYGVSEFDNGQWVDKSWFTTDRVVAILKNWKVKVGDHIQVIKKAAENAETSKMFSYFLLTNQRTKLTASTKDLNVPGTSGNSPDLPPPSGEKTLRNLEGEMTNSIELAQYTLRGLISLLRETAEAEGIELGNDFIENLFRTDGMWRTWNTLIMTESKMQGK